MEQWNYELWVTSLVPDNNHPGDIIALKTIFFKKVESLLLFDTLFSRK